MSARKPMVAPEPFERWTHTRKAAVANCIRAGVLSKADAAKRYGATEDELDAWLAGRVFVKRAGVR